MQSKQLRKATWFRTLLNPSGVKKSRKQKIRDSPAPLFECKMRGCEDKKFLTWKEARKHYNQMHRPDESSEILECPYFRCGTTVKGLDSLNAHVEYRHCRNKEVG